MEKKNDFNFDVDGLIDDFKDLDVQIQRFKILMEITPKILDSILSNRELMESILRELGNNDVGLSKVLTDKTMKLADSLADELLKRSPGYIVREEYADKKLHDND